MIKLSPNPFTQTMETSKKTSTAGAPKPRFLVQFGSVLVILACTCRFASSAERPENTGKRFATPEEAVAALQSATTSADTNALRIILGQIGRAHV